MDYRVRIYAGKVLLREMSYPRFLEAMNDFQRKCHHYRDNERVCIYLEEKEGSEWITRARSADKNSPTDSENAIKREPPK